MGKQQRQIPPHKEQGLTELLYENGTKPDKDTLFWFFLQCLIVVKSD